MRLIDADALMESATIHRSATSNESCVQVDAIDDAPTVDAIPLEWLVSWINRHPNDLRCVWFVSLEMEWRKEQEAR